MSTTSNRSTVLREIAIALDLPLSKRQITELSKHRYVFIDHGNGDEAGNITYYLSWPKPCDDLTTVPLTAWGSATDFPLPDLVLDLDAELPIAETDSRRSRSHYRIMLLKTRYGRDDRRRIDRRARRRVYASYRRVCGWALFPPNWEGLDFETFWAKGGIAALIKQSKKNRPRITSIV